MKITDLSNLSGKYAKNKKKAKWLKRSRNMAGKVKACRSFKDRPTGRKGKSYLGKIKFLSVLDDNGAIICDAALDPETYYTNVMCR